MTDIAPPATGAWYDIQVTVEQVLAILRLTEQDVDVARIDASVPAAAIHLEQYVDGIDVIEGPPPSAALQQALNVVTIALYQRKDPAVFVTAPPEILDPVRSEIRHAKQRWGVA